MLEFLKRLFVREKAKKPEDDFPPEDAAAILALASFQTNGTASGDYMSIRGAAFAAYRRAKGVIKNPSKRAELLINFMREYDTTVPDYALRYALARRIRREWNAA